MSVNPLPLESQFGPMVGAHQVDRAIENVLKYWMTTYLQAVARITDENFERLEPIRNWRISSDMEKMPEDTPPVCIITSPGLAERPEKAGASKYSSELHSGFPYSAIYEYQVGLHLSAKGKKSQATPRALERARMYGLACRLALLQQRDQPPTADSEILGMIDWVNEEFDKIDSSSDRTVCMAIETFHVTVHNVSAWGTGPHKKWEGEDPEDPTWPRVETTDVDIVKVPLEEDL
jgi:hypothetical protein